MNEASSAASSLKQVKPRSEIRSRLSSGQAMPTTVSVKQTTANVKVPKLVSLKELLADPKEEKSRPEQLPTVAFTQEQLTEAWMDYAYGIKQKDLDFFSTLSSFLPEIHEDEMAKVTVHNSTQSSDIIKMKPELLSSVRKTLNNYAFDFEITINKTEAKEIAVTPQEKYKKLVEKNPLLEELRKKLELGF